jgi:hypothetical protein
MIKTFKQYAVGIDLWQHCDIDKASLSYDLSSFTEIIKTIKPQISFQRNIFLTQLFRVIFCSGDGGACGIRR